MKTATRRAGVAFALLLMAAALVGGALSGCVPEPAPSPSPVASSPPSTPLFATDDEALAAATDAYKAYLAMSDLIYSEGASDPERIQSVASSSALADFLSSAKEFQTRSVRTSGQTAFDTVSLQGIVEEKDGAEIVTIYLCSDVTHVDVLDAAGSSIVSPDRDSRTPYQVGVELSESAKLVESRSVWSGKDFC